MTTVGEKIKGMRKLMGLTQRELAEKCGLATGTIQQYELGRRLPSYTALMKIAKALNLPEDGLFQNLAEDNIKEEILFGRKGLLLDNFDRLNFIGQDKAIEQVEILTKVPEYQKTPTEEEQDEEQEEEENK